MEQKIFETKIGDRILKIETGKLAQQAGGSCLVTIGGTSVLATVCMSSETRDTDFFPVTVEFEERLYAAGRIKGSRFLKREGRPTDEAVLKGRAIDRAIRPLFPEGIRNEVQLILTVLSADEENDSEVVGFIGAVAALSISEVPWNGPISAVKVGLVNDEFILNPTQEQLEKSSLDLMIAGTPEKIIMIECGAKIVAEDKMLEAMKFGKKYFQPVIELVNKIQKEIGKEKAKEEDLKPKLEPEVAQAREKAIEEAKKFITQKVNEYLFEGERGTKALRKEGVHEIVDGLDKHLEGMELGEDAVLYAHMYSKELIQNEVSKVLLEKGVRVDGRKLDEIRPLTVENALLERTHGSGLFQRGETQVLSVVTLGSPKDEQLLEDMFGETKKRYIHHYTFAPFSVGEVKRMGGVGRRDIGHGALAEKALEPVIPDKEQFLYTIRVVSETLGSNGSSSMASTCGSTIALMDAGVPIKAPVAGIAMGLVSNKKGDYKILTDIQDLEDGLGGMDFKITGTSEGITAIQLDTKTKGLTDEMVEKTLAQGREARMFILNEIEKVITSPREELSKYAPRIESMKIDPEKIGSVIGSGGKTINEIVEATDTVINIDDDGLVMITSHSPENMERAKKWIHDLVRDPKVGEVYKGRVVKVAEFGAFVNLLPGRDGLLHISEIAHEHVRNVEDVLHEGDEVEVKVIGFDRGKVKLSRKALLKKPEGGRFDKGSGPVPPHKRNDDHRFGPKPPHHSSQPKEKEEPKKRFGLFRKDK